MEFLLAAISLGLLGSLHCIGMCGPIALALPIHKQSPRQKFVSIVAYNSGRIITYSLFGIIFGLIGQSFAVFGFQQILSIVVGTLILLGLILSRFIKLGKLGSKPYQLLNSIKNKMTQLFQKKGIRSFLSIGLLNGLLPCGMVYIALAGAVATGSVYKGALFMAVFGLGTLPFMMAISYYSHLANLRVRSLLRRAVPLTVGLMAVLLILRGANLGIEYISPKLEKERSAHQEQKMNLKCCHKN